MLVLLTAFSSVVLFVVLSNLGQTTMIKRKLKFLSDPSHGWLSVSLADIAALQIAHKISAYSYVNNGRAYLEEDSDAGIFLNAAKAAGWNVSYTESMTDHNHYIRGYKTFVILEEYYISYFNEFLTVAAFAEYHGFSEKVAAAVIECGKQINNDRSVVSDINSEAAPAYAAAPVNEVENEIVKTALSILFDRLREPGETLTSPNATKQFLQLQLVADKSESFCVLFLDNRHRVIEFERMFAGTIDGATVHPREVVRACIKHNAAAVIFSHNHPSGIADPSEADKRITTRLKDALGLIDVRVLDHIIVGGKDTFSFAEKGLI